MSKSVQLCLVFLSLGLLLAVLFLRFDYFALLTGHWLAGLLITCLILMVIRRKPVTPVFLYSSGMIYTAVLLLVVMLFMDRQSIEEVHCSWRLVDKTVEINLLGIDDWNCASVTSPSLKAYLEVKKPALVKVKLPITRDFGFLRARGQIESVDGFQVREGTP